MEPAPVTVAAVLETPTKQEKAENQPKNPLSDPPTDRKKKEPETETKRPRGRPPKRTRSDGIIRDKLHPNPACAGRGFFTAMGEGYMQGLLESNLTTTEIAQRADCSRQTVYRHERKSLSKQATKWFQATSGEEVPSERSDERYEHLCELLEEEPLASAGQLRDLLELNYGICVTKMTIWHDLFTHGKKHFIRPWAPNFAAANWAERRVEFANAQSTQRLKMEDVIFTDESYFRCMDYRRGQYSANVDDVKPRLKERWTATCHVFGLIGLGYKRCFELPPPGQGSGKRGGCVSEDFTKFLEAQPGLLEELKHKTLLLDGARIHTSAHTVKWLADNGISAMVGWPAHSPDLNPIENWWAWLKQKASSEVISLIKNTKNNRTKLAEVIMEHVASTTDKMLEDYTRSFFTRLEVVRMTAGDLVTKKARKEHGC